MELPAFTLTTIAAAVNEVAPEPMRQGLPMRAVRAVAAHLDLEVRPGALFAFASWSSRADRADVIEALEATAAALDGEEAGS